MSTFWLQVPVPQRVMSPPDDSPVVAITTGYTFSAVATRHGVIYYTGRLGGIEEEEGEEGEGEGEMEGAVSTQWGRYSIPQLWAPLSGSSM